MTISSEAHLDRVAAQARENVRVARDMVAERSSEDLLWRPEPAEWGVADCFEHLIATGQAYHTLIRQAMESAPTVAGEVSYRPRWFGRWFIRSSGPEGRIRVRARGPFVPRSTSPDAPDRFAALQDEFLELVDAAREKNLQAIRVPSPLSRFLALTLGECLELLVRHQQRHLQQAQRVLEELERRSGGAEQADGS